MSRKSNIRWIAASFAVVGLTCGYASLAQEPSTGKKVGEKVDDMIQDIKGGFRRAGNAAKDEFSKAKTAINNMGIESRVYGRIHWDKDLNTAMLEISTDENGVITLDGAVADVKAKTRAVELASSTLGVTKVVDRLAVRLPTRTSP
jgi:hyperosmotically inducible protein